MDFPQYRALSNGMVMYKIIDERHFIEVQRVGTRYFRYEHHAEKYPEILRVKEMLDLSLPGIDESTKVHFEEFSDKV